MGALRADIKIFLNLPFARRAIVYHTADLALR